MSFRPCIIIPSYNHALSTEVVAQRLADYHVPLIIINDASCAEDAEILHDLAKTHDWIDAIDLKENQGKGGAVVTGLKTAFERGFSHAVQIDADGQHDSDDLPWFLQTSEEMPDAVITGVPIYDQSVPAGRLIARYLTHVWIWIETLSFTIKDSMCGFRVYPLDATNRVLASASLGKRMDFDPEILVRLYWQGATILSLPTKVTYPPDGHSSFSMWEDNFLISWMHARLVFGMMWRAPNLIWRKFR
jgi:glycosyltransferase involved in cell wall biosynthesis